MTFQMSLDPTVGERLHLAIPIPKFQKTFIIKSLLDKLQICFPFSI